MVFDDSVDMAKQARFAFEFCALESCGKCTPCRIGSTRGGVLAGPELLQSRQRVIELEVENQALRQRIESARERLQALSSRLAFLESEEGAA